MRARLVILALTVGLLAAGCSNDLQSGADYPFLDMGDAKLVYKLEQVIQNDTDVKPYFDFFDGVALTLSYKNSQPDKLTFTEAGAPFRVTSQSYDGIFESEWTIDSSKSPYAVKLKSTGETFCYIAKDKQVTFYFTLGCASNTYEYILVPVTE